MKTIQYDSGQIEKCLKGSFEVEGIHISKTSKENFKKLQNGEIGYDELVHSICERYKRKNKYV